MSIISYYFKVIPELQDYVDFVVYYEGANSFFLDRLIPSNHVSLFINTGNPITVYPNCNKKKPVIIHQGWLKCLHERPYGIELGEYTRSLSIRFKPCAAYSLTLQPMNLLSNKIIPSEELKISKFSNLYDEFASITDTDKIEKLVNDYLVTHLKPEIFDRPKVSKALQIMQDLKSEVRLPFLAKEVGVSTKHLNSLFNKYLGLSPKKFGCIMRFNELVPQIANRKYDDWMSVVENFGYYDQSHFIRDFKKFTGLTPTEFIKDFLFIDNNLFLKSKNLHLLQPRQVN